MTATDPIPSGWDCHAHVFDGRPPVAGSHYQPPVRDLSMLEGEAERIGAGHCVLVQPSVYGTDNGLLLDCLRASAGRHRGVVVVTAAVDDRTLADMHACGVRGVRYNLVSPSGNSAAELAATAPRLREIGWHVQWYARATDLAVIADVCRQQHLPCVLDHLAGFTPPMAASAALWASLLRLADMGAWVKLGGWYRLDAPYPYESLDDVTARIVDAFAGHCVWGSDWPHTRFLEAGVQQSVPAYAGLWRPVARAVGEARAEVILRDNPRALYS